VNCFISQNVSGPCGGCGRTPVKTHITSLAGNVVGISCESCCPVHGQEVLWDQAEPVTIAGNQEELF
jgi:hypothetical protein